MRAELIALASINSGSFNASGVDAVGDRLQSLFAPLDAPIERLALAPYRRTADDGSLREYPLGHALRLRKRPDAPLRVFLCGHMDTVFGAEHPFQQVRPMGDDRLHGPGVADLKGGLLVMLLALSALERSDVRHQIGWEVLLTPDEEIGSQGSLPLLAEAARRNHFGLVYEPALPDGNLAAQRKGSGNFDVIVHGRAAHAGRDPQQGRNAIRAAADLVAMIDGLNGQREGVTVNPGYIHGGGALSIVPDRCVFKFNVRTTAPADECWVHDQLDLALSRINAREGFRLELRGGFTRPPKAFDAATQRLAGLLADCGQALSLDLQFKPTGGCCDGNNLAALGLPNIDNLGVVGGEIHSDREFMRVSSLSERAQLSALLLLRLASGEMHWTPAP
ncbi:MAG: hydrolase [Nevskiaceae bacterium]|nr:MAG: hydrolase [Nevskiaceae bacterium]